ncbi:MAG: 2-oxoglutarate and iron-dependent oxygenase domain-containing protein [Acidimicrobiales bacterium]|nr:2-oxoglutarate and iron-dependent oxygenase domain-containing protein [Acidimicrobiales bacterium]
MEILDVDLLAFESGSADARRAVVDGVARSLVTGFVYVEHDLSIDLIDEAYAQLETFFTLPQDRKDAYVVPGSNGQTGYTGLLVETAAIADVPDWKEMLNWGAPLGEGHPLRAKYPQRYGPPTLPESDLPGVHDVLMAFHHSVADLQRRVLRIIAEGLGAHQTFFDEMLTDGATLTRAIHYPAMDQAPGEQHVWAGEHADINLITALPRASAAGLQVKTDGGWIDAAPPEDSAIINTGLMLERLSNGTIPSGIHRVVSGEGQQGDRYSVVQFAHPTPWTVLSPMASTVTSDNPLRYSSMAASDALDKVLWEINLTDSGRRLDAKG